MKKVTLKNGREFLIRKATENDGEEMAKFKVCISGESDFLSFGKGELEITPETEGKIIGSENGTDNSVIILGLMDGEIAGFVTFQGGTRVRKRHGGEMGIAVLRKYWGLGIGGLLLLDLKELVDENLVSLNLKQIALNLMYATYQAAEGKARAAALYQYFSWDMCKDIKIEELFTVGPEELKGTDAFMEEWISFLKKTPGDRAADLLSEACLDGKGIRCLCETAREAGTRHPALYERACAYLLEEGKELDCEQLGLEAIEILPEKLVIRGRIADLTAQAATRLNHPKVLAECYQAAFDSQSTLNHYLRLFELPDYEDRADKGAKYAKMLTDNVSGEGYYNNKQMLTNAISQDQKKVILFFNREFELIYQECQRDKDFLGWSSQFKGIAVPLFMLLLDRSPKLSKAGHQLLNELKFRIGFMEGDGADLAARFLYWKAKVPLSDEHYQKYRPWLEAEVDKRAEAIVGGGYRKSYYKAALLITALGETMESNGKLNGRRALIDHYKKLYPRKRAFKGEIDMFLLEVNLERI
ncbi:GNAT family N-acetyltransferase [Desulfosporosinus sp. BICA1-9]|uniref:GNAT family N-acetyltransferase n=1 Tax=Desulfosporosinus sp. BICA1-9 TaxID=1531958 RepID=UPI0005F1209A|nr:GNAT family N-acetyltransferase [Desulfosporosinus sp. BICA1-9]KJS50024.1 MAG: hypothetical protein VR66_05180 [Peptococcaceae bacterium BRH_c23]KJS85645.1 MAG: hypothetical protein JL57_18445 [Desulfosporosinus sp. BICA1-9]